MRVAIAGYGDMARYIIEEFSKVGHELVVLTRSHKPDIDRPGVTQFVTDYSLESLAVPLRDAEVLVSTIGDQSSSYIDIHRNLIKACQQSPKCKRFMPSEYAGNLDTHPEQPAFYARSREPVRQLLREQTDLEWTLILVGWLADYVLPAANRYIRDFGEACPINLVDGTMVIPGTGDEPISFIWSRDVAKAMASLVSAPKWEQHTFVTGELSTWNNVATLLRAKYQPDLKVQHLSVSSILETIASAEDALTKGLAEHQLYSASHASALPQERLQLQRQKYFPGVQFRTLRGGLDDFDRDTSIIV
jgi:swainsonine biosynthesis oxidoreductase SwnR